MAKINLEELCDVAFAHEEGDPIDWNQFKQGSEQAMKMIGTSILDMFDKDKTGKLDKDEMAQLQAKLSEKKQKIAAIAAT